MLYQDNIDVNWNEVAEQCQQQFTGYTRHLCFRMDNQPMGASCLWDKMETNLLNV